MLANPTNRRLIQALDDGPSYPRELARRLTLTEGQVQKHLHILAAGGIVEGHWQYDGKTVKEYRLCADGVNIRFADGTIEADVHHVDPA
jgi:predicted transcriptional regulator